MYEQKIIEGVKVVTCKIPHAYSVYIGIWIKAGSMYEHKAINGISHFIEHMVFKGSKLRSAKQIAEEMDSIGGQLNGFTEKESTCFYIKVLNTHVKQGLDILFDMVFNPAFKEEDIKKSSEILEKITGIKPILFAPPYGDFNDEVVKVAEQLGYKVILWSLDTIDWNNPSPQTIVDRVMSKYHNGAIVLMHPTKNTVEALPQIINQLKEKGYKITKVSEVIVDNN